MPSLSPILDETHNEETTGESLKLFLPSELSAGYQAAWCPLNISALEFWFCYAQANDSLAELCCLCQLLQGLLDQKAKYFSQAQRNQMRSQGLLMDFRPRFAIALAVIPTYAVQCWLSIQIRSLAPGG